MSPNSNGAAAVIKVVGFQLIALFFTDKTVTIYILGCDAVGCLCKQLAQLAVSVIHIYRFITFAKVTDSHIRCIVGVSIRTRL